MPFKTIELNDGREIPAIAYGTGSVMKFKDVSGYVEQAIEAGFSHIDTAAFYQTEPSVGKALREIGLSRSDLFITTKYSYNPAGGGLDVPHSFKASLAHLGTTYVDLYLIHHPMSMLPGGLEPTWREFEQLYSIGLAKSIGVSNFNLDQLKDLVKICKIKPVVNQISLNPYNWEKNRELVKFCADQGIVIEAYSSLAPITAFPGGPVDKPVAKIAKRLKATPAQVIFAWVRSKGAVIVTTTSKKERLHEYLNAGDLPPLTEDDITAIETAAAIQVSALVPLTFIKSVGTRIITFIFLSVILFAIYQVTL